MGKKTALLLCALIVIAVLGTIYLACSQPGQTSTADGHCVLIHGSCIVINWDATPETWEEARGHWDALRE